MAEESVQPVEVFLVSLDKQGGTVYGFFLDTSCTSPMLPKKFYVITLGYFILFCRTLEAEYMMEHQRLPAASLPLF